MGVISGRLVSSAGPIALPVPTVGQVVENVTALRALTGSAALPAVAMRQYGSAANLGGGVFMWDAVARDDDGVLRFNSGGLGSSAAGWQRLWDGAGIAVEMAGAVLDGIADDTAALALARTVAAAQQVPVLLPAGTLRYTSTLVIDDDDVSIVGTGVGEESGAAIGTRLLFDGTGPAILIGRDVDTAVTATYRTQLHGFTLKTPTTCTYGIRAWCPAWLRIENVKVVGPLGNTSHCISIACGVDVVVRRCDVVGDNNTYAADRTTYANGVQITHALGTPSTTVFLDDVYVHRAYEGLYAYASYGSVTRCAFEGCFRGFLNWGCPNLVFSDCWFEGCGYDATTAACGYLTTASSTALYGCKLVGYATPEFAFNVVGSARLQIVGGDYAMSHATPKLVNPGDYTPGSGYVSVADAVLNTVAYGIAYLAGTGVADRARRYVCTGSPEGAVTGSVGDLCFRIDGGAGTALYVKESGTGSTGWAAHGPPGIGSLAPGNQNFSTGQWHIQYQRLQLTSTQRLTLAGTARYILTDL